MLVVIQFFHLQDLFAVFSRWTASAVDILLVLLKFFLCVLLFSHWFHFIAIPFPPYCHLFPTTNFPVFHSKHDCYWTSHVGWHPVLLLLLSTKPLYFTHAYNTFGSFCHLPYCSSLQLFQRSYSLKSQLYAFSSLRLQHSTENREKRACSHQASQQCWLDVFQCSSSQHWRF